MATKKRGSQYWSQTVYLRKDQWDFLDSMIEFDEDIKTASHLLRVLIDSIMPIEEEKN